MFPRKIGQIGEEKKKNCEASIQIAKDALNMDMNDGESWCKCSEREIRDFIDILGNGYFTNFFVNLKMINELQNALKCYMQAVSLLLIHGAHSI